MMKTLTAILVLLILTPLANAGLEPEALVTETAQRMSETGEGYEWLDTVVDFDAVGVFVLGKHIKTLNQGEIDQFKQGYRAKVLEMLKKEAQRFSLESISITGYVQRRPNDVIISSQVATSDGETHLVRWRLLNRTNGWRLVDLEVYDIWLTVEHRAQVAVLLDRNSGNIQHVLRELE